MGCLYFETSCVYIYVYIYEVKCNLKSLDEKVIDATIAKQVYNQEKYQIMNIKSVILSFMWYAQSSDVLMYLTNFPPSQYMIQGCFIVGSHAQIKTPVWLNHKSLVTLTLSY